MRMHCSVQRVFPLSSTSSHIFIDTGFILYINPIMSAFCISITIANHFFQLIFQALNTQLI